MMALVLTFQHPTRKAYPERLLLDPGADLWSYPGIGWQRQFGFNVEEVHFLPLFSVTTHQSVN